jgi:curli biogenesis system outer membrane secretion channel CsgG
MDVRVLARSAWLAFAIGAGASGLAQADAPAERPVLAVLKFQDETGAMPFQGGIGRVVTNMLATVLEEQDLAESGLLKPGERAKIGQLTGAQYLVMGTITAFQPDTETKVSGGMFRRARVEQTHHGSYLALDLRVVDASTGEVSYARTIEGHTSGRETTIDLAQRDAGMQMIENEADAQAVRGAVLEIIDYLECVMVRRDACIAAFEAKETERRDTTRKTFRPDGPQH